MKIIAHRGDHTAHAENTLPAFQSAVDAHADGFEFDVRLTSDHVPVVFHYVTLMHTTGSGVVANYTYDDIRQLRVTHPETAAQYLIPTLRDVLEAFGGKTYLEIHVQSFSPETITEIGALLNEYPSIWDQAEITSFEPAVLLGFQNICPGLKTDFLFGRASEWMTLDIAAQIAVEKARLAKAHAVHFHPSQLSASVVDYMRKHGFEVHAWDINTQEQFDHITALGIEQFSTDNLSLFPHLLRKPGLSTGVHPF